jgi:hypothetical protein
MYNPILIFCYNRLDHLRETVDALSNNDLVTETELYFYSDGPKDKEGDREKVEQVRAYIRGYTGPFKEIHVIERDENYGLARNVVQSVTEIVNEYGSVIALEDDLITAPQFLTVMNDMLDRYKKDKRVWSVSGFSYPIELPSSYKEDFCLALRASSFGWGTWKDRWDTADWKVEDYDKFKTNKRLKRRFDRGGELTEALISCIEEHPTSVWAIKWTYNHFLNNAYALYPRISLVDNNGLDGTGEHEQGLRDYWNRIDFKRDAWNYNLYENVPVDRKVIKAFKELFVGKMNFKYYVKVILKKMGIFHLVYRRIRK